MRNGLLSTQADRFSVGGQGPLASLADAPRRPPGPCSLGAVARLLAQHPPEQSKGGPVLPLSPPITSLATPSRSSSGSRPGARAPGSVGNGRRHWMEASRAGEEGQSEGSLADFHAALCSSRTPSWCAIFGAGSRMAADENLVVACARTLGRIGTRRLDSSAGGQGPLASLADASRGAVARLLAQHPPNKVRGALCPPTTPLSPPLQHRPSAVLGAALSGDLRGA